MSNCLLPRASRALGSQAILAALVAFAGESGAQADPNPPASPPKPAETSLENLLAEADGVLSDVDNIRAAKSSKKVFVAAHALLHAGRKDAALPYFQQALQLSPWDLEEQLAYAHLLMSMDKKPEALEIAGMVETRTESDALYLHARKLAGKSMDFDGGAFGEKPTDGPCVCLVPIGPVNQVALLDSAKKLHETLGVPVFIRKNKLALGAPDRSAFDHWVRTEIMPKITWNTPEERALWASMGIQSPKQKVESDAFFAALLAQLKKEGHEKAVAEMEETALFFRQRDRQWEATALLGQVMREKSNPKTVLVGISEADFYSGDGNFLFGSAAVGSPHGVVSYARYRADFYNDPPDRARLTLRMHKQLLSTIGNALGVPRPTDPTSARSYPRSLSEHDSKSEYMSEQCIAGFERAMGVKLPDCAHHPDKLKKQ